MTARAYTPADYAALVATAMGEARGEPPEGRALVMRTVLRRAQKRASTPAAEAHRAWQFSCWNANDPNRALCAGWERALLLALETPVNASAPTHYHAASISPAWAQGHTPCTAVGAHLFYNDVA